MRVLEVSKIKILRCMRSWLKTIIQCQDIFRVMTKLWLNKQHLKILFYLTNRTRFALDLPWISTKKEIFLHFNSVLLWFPLVYMYAYKAMTKNNIQCSKCESGHSQLQSPFEKSQWLNSRYKMVLLPLAFVGFAILPPFSNP